MRPISRISRLIRFSFTRWPSFAQMPDHLPHAKERRFQKLFINLAHERQVHRRLAFGPVQNDDRKIDSSLHC